MNIKVICVGKSREKYYREAAAEYEKRLSRFGRVKVMELADEPEGGSLSALLDREGARILSQLRDSDYVIGLCIEGRELDSPGFSAHLSDVMLRGKSTVCFVIGGSWGLSDAVKNRCDFKMSMGKMTFPHQLARVMLLEQVFRAFKIMNGEQYHK